MTNQAILTTVLALALPLFVASPGCARDDGPEAARAGESPAAKRKEQPEVKSFTGTLRGGIAAGGGETTGWILEGDGAVGGLDVDVSKVQKAAEKFDGKRVTIKGHMTEKDWPERGRTPVLVAGSIEAAPEKGDDDAGRPPAAATGTEGRG